MKQTCLLWLVNDLHELKAYHNLFSYFPKLICEHPTGLRDGRKCGLIFLNGG